MMAEGISFVDSGDQAREIPTRIMRELWKPVLKFVAWFAAILFVIGVILRLTMVEVMVVGHNGMAPTMEAGDTVLVWKSSDFSLGDIVVCTNPENPRDLVMGRIVGPPNATVESERGQLVINGQTPDMDWHGNLEFTDTLNDRTDTVQLGTEKLGNHEHEIFHRGTREFSLRKYDVEPDRFFLLGDNRFHSADDSRNFGTVAASECMGHVFMRLFLPDQQINDLGHGNLDILR
jgi:signal peptidase I